MRTRRRTRTCTRAPTHRQTGPAPARTRLGRTRTCAWLRRYNVLKKLGGNPDLTESGKQYAEWLGTWVRERARVRAVVCVACASE